MNEQAVNNNIFDTVFLVESLQLYATEFLHDMEIPDQDVLNPPPFIVR
ncbi:hypothetical protein SDC9_178006 [bioreactor metagenome]|uniref:Uncharacterized protein n=1 Tax=bioreactor metagenome TaxID=1076179 RepID=A0A645GUT1_9ZZZZ